jgi:hypothetical protein
MVWNIYEGRNRPRTGNGLLDALSENDGLPQVAAGISALAPDILLINEAMIWRGFPFSNGVNQLTNLVDRTGFPHFQYVDCNWLGLTGVKVVAAFSRFQLGFQTVIGTWDGLTDIGFNTLRTTFTADGRLHHLFSTRYQPIHTDKPPAEIALATRRNRLGLENAVNVLQTLPANEAVIFGGDLNVDPSHANFQFFAANSGLQYAGPNAGVDHLFYRGPYHVKNAQIVPAPILSSDHDMVLFELSSNPAFFAEYGRTIKLKHRATGRYLHSHSLNYDHTRSSRQQQVTGFYGADDNDFWIVKRGHRARLGGRRAATVRNNDIIRLQHVATGKNLHSHSGFPAPCTGDQQEVTGFGANGTGDTNDNWRIEVEGGGQWEAGTPVRLVHVNTGLLLHSNAGIICGSTFGQQEVSAVQDRDDNNLWYLSESK